MRCDAGAYFVKGLLKPVCDKEAVFQVVTADGLDLLVVYCEEHAEEHARPMVLAGGARLERVC